MKRTPTHEQRARLLIERRGQRQCNRDRALARAYTEKHMILARPLLPKRGRERDQAQKEMPL